jgi:hypothetical protein
MEEPPCSPEEAEAAWNKVFVVLQPPPRERIHLLRPGYEIQVADFAWASPRVPRDKEGMVHLTGYDENMLNIWYAELELSEVRYIGPKPTSYPNGKNPFPVRPATISATLLFGRLRLAFTTRWHWWKARHVRRQTLLKYGQAAKEKS